MTRVADPIPLVDLKAAHREAEDAIRRGMERVIANTQFVLGPDVVAFEQEYARFIGSRHCIGLSNGTDALEMLFRALKIGPGDEVIVPVNTFIATALAVSRTGATPVFVDCDDSCLLIDPARIDEKITTRTKAIVPVDLFGQVAPMEELEALASSARVPIVEDAAQAQGAKRNGRNAGTFGVASATSFYPGKNLGAYGDAGAVNTDDDELAQSVRNLRNYGSEKKYEHPEIGFNCRLDTLQAVVLNAKLPLLNRWNQQRREAAERYDQLLAGVDRVHPIGTPAGNEPIYHLYVVRVPERDTVLEQLQAEKIGAGIHYPRPLHLVGAYRELGYAAGDFPVAEKAAGEILSLPLYPHLTADQQSRVVEELIGALP